MLGSVLVERKTLASIYSTGLLMLLTKNETPCTSALTLCRSFRMALISAANPFIRSSWRRFSEAAWDAFAFRSSSRRLKELRRTLERENYRYYIVFFAGWKTQNCFCLPWRNGEDCFDELPCSCGLYKDLVPVLVRVGVDLEWDGILDSPLAAVVAAVVIV